jgi:hypothetical protein
MLREEVETLTEFGVLQCGQIQQQQQQQEELLQQNSEYLSSWCQTQKEAWDAQAKTYHQRDEIKKLEENIELLESAQAKTYHQRDKIKKLEGNIELLERKNERLDNERLHVVDLYFQIKRSLENRGIKVIEEDITDT